MVISKIILPLLQCVGRHESRLRNEKSSSSVETKLAKVRRKRKKEKNKKKEKRETKMEDKKIKKNKKSGVHRDV